MFFLTFEHLKYSPYKGVDKKTLVNITTAILPKYTPITNSTLYLYHTVKDGETPEILSHKYYDSPIYHWVIMLLNEIVDPYFDWPMDSQELESYVKSKYGEANIGKAHHLIDVTTGKRVDEVEFLKYYTREGDLIASPPHNLSPISNLEHEIEVNNNKREMKILRKRYLQTFLNDFEQLMKKDVA